MSNADPYTRKLVNPSYYAQRNELVAKVVAVLRGQLDNRNLQLIPQPSRAIRQGEIHELIVTDENAAPGCQVQRIAYVAFVEFLNGGVLLHKDSVLTEKGYLGTIAGYDLAHFPNHMNVALQGSLESGEDRGLEVGMQVVFKAHTVCNEHSS
ncbi:MAG TPA: hypothetical protein GXZ88_00610 [Firmicutes bacterium]|jgi:hypothetical protein|nr:hypothetical protein [Candidatus Fermentithermobacillaceae bacterium]